MSYDVEIPCSCPGKPHETDIVRLREKLGLAAGVAIQRMVINANEHRYDAPALEGLLAEGYLLYGVESWSLVDEGGRPVPVTEATIRYRLLSDFTVANPIAEAADGIYMAAVLLPLAHRAQTSSPSTPTNGSTSRPRSGTSKRPKPLKPSSTTTSPTGGTSRTSSSLAGVSSS